MCKELPVIPVNKVVDPKKNNRRKMEGQGGGEAQGVADQKKLCRVASRDNDSIFSNRVALCRRRSRATSFHC
jgi:hypothetical protein